VFSRGLVTFNDDGSRANATVDFTVEYALVGSTDWQGGGKFIDLRSSATIEAEAPTVRLLRPNRTLPRNRYGEKYVDINDEYYYYSAPVTNPHRYDLIAMDKLTGDLVITKGVSVTENTVATVPTWGSTVIPLAAIYVDTSGIGTILDYRDRVTGWGSGFAVTYKDSSSVYVAAGTLSSAQYTVIAATSEALRYNVSFAVAVEGQYQVRVRRLTADNTSDRVFSDLTWGVLRTINLSPPFDATGLATTELRIKANDQLQRVIDTFSGVCTSILPDYDYLTDTWIVRPTQNPASLGRAVLQGPGNARSLEDDRIDIEALEDFHNYCRVNNYQFNMVRDFVASVYDTVADVWAAGFASPCEIDGKWSVVIDRDKTVAVQHFTPRNSWGFSFERTYPDRPHGWRIKFINEDNDYTQDERIVYDDGYTAENATKFESFDLSGITDPDLVWKVGRRRIAEGRLRPERYTFNVDIEHLVCRRGDLVYITHDVLGSGISAGRIKSLIVDGSSQITGITIDAPVDMQFGINYGVQIRSVDGNRLQAIATSTGTDIDTLNFVTPIPAGTQVAIGDLFGFGVLTQEKLEAIVKSMRRSQDMVAELTCLPLARQIFSAETGSIPEFNPNITTSVGVVTPFILDVRSDESVIVVQPNGSFSAVIRMTFGRFSSSFIAPPTGIEVQYKRIGDTVFSSRFISKHEAFEVTISDVVQGETYDLRVRYTYADRTGIFSPILQHTVVGMATLPADVTGLVLEGNYLRWLYNRPRDFAGFVCRTSTDINASWDQMYKAHEGLLSDTQFDITNFQRGVRVFAIKALDFAGNYSLAEARLNRDFDFGTPLIANIVNTIDYSGDGFLGTINNGSVISGVLKASDTSAYLPEGSAVYLPTGADSYLPSQFSDLAYIAPLFISGSSDIPGRLSINLAASGGVRCLYKIGVDDLYLPTGGDSYLPTGTDEYLPARWYSDTFRLFPAYVDLKLGDAFQFKLVGDSGEQQAEVTTFQAIIDVDDETETFVNKALLAGGSRIALTKTYRSIRVVNGNLRSGSTAVRVEIQDFNNTLGPLVQAFNSAGTGVAATIDGTIQGVRG
jgi:hypothetical protein